MGWGGARQCVSGCFVVCQRNCRMCGAGAWLFRMGGQEGGGAPGECVGGAATDWLCLHVLAAGCCSAEQGVWLHLKPCVNVPKA